MRAAADAREVANLTGSVRRVLLRDDASALQQLLATARQGGNEAVKLITRIVLECIYDEETGAAPPADQHRVMPNVEGLLACLICDIGESGSISSLLGSGSGGRRTCSAAFTTASQQIADLRNRGPRQVCQYAFRRNDIVWICRTCQADETCVLCNTCYRDSDHTGHEVSARAIRSWWWWLTRPIVGDYFHGCCDSAGVVKIFATLTHA